MNKQIKKITVAYATDNNYVYPIIVSITSLFENADQNTKYFVVILISQDVSEINKNKLKLLGEIYERHDILLHEMLNEFSSFTHEKLWWSTACYYPLLLPNILSKDDKCIVLDGDTIILKDLGELYNIKMHDNYVGGVPDRLRLPKYGMERVFNCLVNKSADRQVCTAVMLFNLKKMRLDQIVEKFKDLLTNADKSLIFRMDHDIINAVCYEGILDINLKFGIHTYQFEKNEDVFKLYEEEEIAEAIRNPYVLHFQTSDKPWLKQKHSRNILENVFWHYAKQNPFYKEICEHYGIKV